MDHIEALGAHYHQQMMAEQRKQMEQSIIDRQAAEIATLTAKLAEYKENESEDSKQFFALSNEIIGLKKQLAEAMKDAERYRYLVGGSFICDRIKGSYAEWDGSDGVAGFNKVIDAAIRAMNG